MAAHKKRHINLLPYGTFDSSVKGRVLNWSLSTFRTIVVIVEIIVIAGFLARFWIDAQNASLDETILQKIALIESYEEFETNYRNYQNKLATISESIEERNTKVRDLEAISSQITPEVVITNILFNPNNIVVQGQSLSEQDIERLILKLRQHDTFQGIYISQLESDEFSAYLNFDLNVLGKSTTNDQNGEEESN